MALVAGCGPKPAPAAPPPPAVGVITVRTEAATLATELPGRTVAAAISEVRPQVNGVVKARLFTEGARVRAGQPLYQIDPALYRAAYDQARAQLANAQAAAATARSKAQRYGDLVKINAVSRQDFDDADAASKEALAAVQQAEATAATARINLAYTRVTAPIAGRIGRSTITPGALVTASQATALATITALDQMYVDVVESSDDMLALRRALAHGGLDSPAGGRASRGRGARVTLTLSDGEAYPQPGELRVTDPDVDATTGSVTLRAIFPNPAGVLLPGMYVRERLVQAVDPQAILIPQQAVSHDEKGRPTAMVVGAGDVAELRVLTTGRTIGDRWFVTSGLRPGDRLIVDGLIKIRKPGDRIQPTPLDGSGAAAPAMR